MKFNKKLVVTSLSTVLGLGIVGSISGTFAWYQYSTRASASIIGVSSAEAGMLQIKASTASTWADKDLATDDLIGTRTDRKIYPVTFGGFAKNEALPAKAYKNPEAGEEKMNIEKNEASAAKQYIQYTVNLRAVNAAGSLVEKDVYISDLVLTDTSTSVGNVTNALRMHIACGSKYFLVAPGDARDMDCHGKLDLNGDGALDTINDTEDHRFEWDKVAEPAEKLEYGFYNEAANPSDPEELDETKQTTYTTDEVVNGRGSDGKIAHNDDKLIGTTPTTGSLNVTVTIWLEGWELLGTTPSAIWDAATIGKTVRAGLVFDIGAGAFSA